MRDHGPRLWILALALGAAAGALAATEKPPVAVSPGSGERITTIEGRCPTFSWAEVREAERYELVVYRLGEDGEEAEPVLTQRLPGAAESWTPPLDHCLDRGGRYAWSVRAVGEERASEWSAPSLFEVAAGPSAAELEEALAVVREYLVSHTDLEATANGVTPSASAREGRPASAEPPETLASPAPVQLSVDGGVAATSFTGDGSTLTNLDPANLSAGTAGIDISGTAANVTGTVALANGGTGATDAAGARANLGVVVGPHTIDTTCHWDSCDGRNFINLDAASLSIGIVAEPRVDPVLARDAELAAAIDALDCPVGQFVAGVEGGQAVCLTPYLETWTLAPGGAAVTIPESGASGAGSPYPSTLTVASFDGFVGDVNVTLEGLSHSYSEDIDIVLVAPTGQAVVLMSDAGSDTELTDLELTFDDEAGSFLPSGEITAGAYRPTDFEEGETLSPPAPAGPYSTNLADLDGLDPNGEWRLFIEDDYPSADGGSLVSWSLTLTDAASGSPVPVGQGGTGARDATAARSNLGAAAAADLTSHMANVAAHHGAPTTLPPSGAAGGALAGTYPNPTIGPNAVASAEIADGSVTEDDLAADSVSSEELVDGAVATSDIGVRPSVGAHGTGQVLAGYTVVQFDTTDWSNGLSNVSSIFYPSEPGLYLITVTLAFNGSLDFRREARLVHLDASGTVTSVVASTFGHARTVSMSAVFPFQGDGDKVFVEAWSTSNETMNTLIPSRFAMTWIAPLP